MVGWEREMHLLPLLVPSFAFDRWGLRLVPWKKKRFFSWSLFNRKKKSFSYWLLLCRIHEDAVGFF
jgi:hypothetical protein